MTRSDRAECIAVSVAVPKLPLWLAAVSTGPTFRLLRAILKIMNATINRARNAETPPTAAPIMRPSPSCLTVSTTSFDFEFVIEFVSTLTLELELTLELAGPVLKRLNEATVEPVGNVSGGMGTGVGAGVGSNVVGATVGGGSAIVTGGGGGGSIIVGAGVGGQTDGQSVHKSTQNRPGQEGETVGQLSLHPQHHANVPT